MTTTGSVSANVAPTTPPPTKAAQPTPQALSSNSSQQQAALRQMLAKYAYDQSHAVDGRTLSALGKQIMAAAKALGQHVTLPHAPATASEGTATNSTQSAVPTGTGRLNLTA